LRRYCKENRERITILKSVMVKHTAVKRKAKDGFLCFIISVP
jgi:hypothetical protein